ncbi:MAG: hypothetical protein KatS3mg131_0018 [Candidatus Tectimicrobiota bacterium]|nr:MAG: hypothetical protein KatS3mg131_0018 [Candidatus Tectomicrobia bacterium]
MAQPVQQRLAERGRQRGLALPPEALAQLERYVQLLLQWRRYLDLTGLRDAERLVDVLIAESLDFLRPELLPSATRLLDLGSGAGIPGIPLAICAPQVEVTLLERAEKKIAFLERAVAVLQLRNCRPCWAQAEALARRLPPAQRFDVVVARGVGPVVRLLTLAAPLLRPGGKLVLRKPCATPELAEAAPRLKPPAWQGLEAWPLPASPGWQLLAITRGGAPESDCDVRHDAL